MVLPESEADTVGSPEELMALVRALAIFEAVLAEPYVTEN
jgi:hypothetical protein